MVRTLKKYCRHEDDTRDRYTRYVRVQREMSKNMSVIRKKRPNIWETRVQGYDVHTESGVSRDTRARPTRRWASLLHAPLAERESILLAPLFFGCCRRTWYFRRRRRKLCSAFSFIELDDYWTDYMGSMALDDWGHGCNILFSFRAELKILHCSTNIE